MTKDWSGNGKSTFITIGASNHTDKEREEHDFYATSPVAIDRLVRSFELPKKIWECACGTGCLSERLVEFGHDVVSTDLIDRGYGDVQDFFKADTMPDGCECILTNPPYKYALEFVQHSLDLLPDGGLCVMFLKTTFLEGHDGWNKGIEWNERELSYHRPAIARLYEKFKENPKKLDVEYWRGFYKMFKENMERKKDGDKGQTPTTSNSGGI